MTGICKKLQELPEFIILYVVLIFLPTRRKTCKPFSRVVDNCSIAVLCICFLLSDSHFRLAYCKSGMGKKLWNVRYLTTKYDEIR